MKNKLAILSAFVILLYSSAFSQDVTVPANNNLILDGTNRWIFHTPDNGSTTAYFAPWLGSDWGWDKFQFLNNGNLQIAGSLKAGDVLLNGTLASGLATEVGGTTPILNMSLNFRGGSLNSSYKGAAFRIDNRSPTFNLFQWYYRPASVAPGQNELLLMSLSEDGKLEVNSQKNAGGTLVYGGLIGTKNAGHELNLVGGIPVDQANPMAQASGGHIRLGGNGRGDGDKNVIQLIQNGVERMRVNDGGNVGIHTSTPQSFLSIVKGNTGRDTDGLDGSLIYINNATSPDGSIVIKTHGLGEEQTLGALKFHTTPDNVNYSQAAIKALAGEGGQAHTLAFFTSISNTQQVGNEVMRIKGNRVGIGTKNPDAALAVKGIIHSEEVKVDVNVPGPDYVFEKSYSLPSLEEVKSYIDQNKHLPEIPSAKEMEANGVNVGEMNMLLLKKIEELTLYVLRQDERIKQLEKSQPNK
jgi:hypothetical protein